MTDNLEEWARAAAAGDPAATAALIRATQAEVWRLHAHLVDPQTADDLTQETYLRALRSLPRFRGESSVRTWLLSVARRTAVDEVRARQRRRARDARAHPTADELVLRDVADSYALHALLDALDPPRREAFVLTQLIGLSYAEAAAVAGCPVGTIRSRVARARSELLTAVVDDDSDRARNGD
jgi:RNA polymerase sigma-70 factor (ECF subfamily)